MGDIALKGAELKKMVALAKKRDLNFAYCPGNDPKEDVFVLDIKKNPEVIGRVARAEGTGTKLCLGRASVTGKVMSLSCERELPQVAKKLKKFLKFEGIAMNIIVLDMEGNVLEQDVEDLGDADEDDDTSDDADDASDDEVDDSADDQGERLKTLKNRAAQLQGAIKDAPGDAQATLVKGFKSALGAMQGGDLDTAEDTFTKLEGAITKLAGVAADTQTNTPDPALSKLTEVSATLSKRIDALGEAEGVSKLRAVHGVLNSQITDGDVKKAAGTAKALGDAIGRLAGQADATPDTENGETAFRNARVDLEPMVLDLLQKGLGDVGKMRSVLSYFIEKGEAGDFAGALKAVPGLKTLIAAAQSADQTAAEADIPAGVVPFVRARLEWIKTRSTLKSEMTKLQAEILAVCQGDAFPTIAKDSKTLFTYLDVLDTRLEDALEALVQEPDGAQREKLKDAARKVLSEYQSELNTPFFQAVDSNNGFKPVNVRGAAIATLGEVSAALSAAA